MFSLNDYSGIENDTATLNERADEQIVSIRSSARSNNGQWSNKQYEVEYCTQRASFTNFATGWNLLPGEKLVEEYNDPIWRKQREKYLI